jgi:hypothetical protein
VEFPFIDLLKIHPYFDSSEEIFSKLTSKHIFVYGIKASTSSSGSWGVGKDVWHSTVIKVKPADYVASILEIPDLTGDLLFKYVLDCLKPTLWYNGDTPLKHRINKLKANGVIPIEPKQHLWYHAWYYELYHL